jgi:CRP/FNR family transcriptional regulator
MADTCVARVPVFAGLSADDQRRVEALAVPTRLGVGETAYSPADAHPRLLVVHTGRLKVFRLAANGSEQIVRLLGPGDFTGEGAVFSGQPPEDHAAALEECRLCVFRHEDLGRLIAAHPEVGLRMLAAVSERLSDAERRLHSLASRDVESRLADYLLGLPSTWASGVLTVALPLAKKDVASLLDTTPETLSRALRSMAAQGLIALGAGRSVTITRPDRLGQLVDEL